MGYKDLRQWIDRLEKEKQLAHIKNEVDWRYEIAAIGRKACDVYDQSCPALLFENIKGHKPPGPSKFFIGGIQTYTRLALALDMPALGKYPTEIAHEYRRRLKNPIPPVMVDRKEATCKQNIDKGDDVDLTKFPVPYYNERDGGRYFILISAITKDPESDWVNVASVRMMLRDEKSLCIFVDVGRGDTGSIYAKYVKRNEPMPICITVGVDPESILASATPLAPGLSEYDYMGAIRKEPVEVVKAESCDIPVFAHAEIVIEGTMDPHERAVEGPFAEFTGYYSGVAQPKPVVRVNTVTYRDDPIFLGTLEGYPQTEEHNIMLVALTTSVWDILERCGVPGVVDVACLPSACVWTTVCVSIKPMILGHAQRVALALIAQAISWNLGKFIIFVDDDIDPWNLEMINWAIAQRCDPSKDIHFYRRTMGFPIDPSIPEEDRGWVDRVLMDATRPFHWKPNPQWGSEGVGKGVPLKFPPVGRPSAELLEHVNEIWDGLGIKPVKKFVGKGEGQFVSWWSQEFIERLKRGEITL
jgi:4-hydroxy-3-polyprenylbenzoate decarboxylase